MDVLRELLKTKGYSGLGVRNTWTLGVYTAFQTCFISQFNETTKIFSSNPRIILI